MKDAMNRNRRIVLAGGILGGLALFIPGLARAEKWITSNVIKDKKASFPFVLPDAEWKKRLSPEAYRILREHGTERAGSSLLNHEKRNGVYHCAGCDAPVFSSKTKFESGTGWPSFYAPIDRSAVGTSTDFKLIVPRTEVHCARCGGHLGHVFRDGPPQTGKRYCVNGVALTFKPAS